jgi:hypothetical protein
VIEERNNSDDFAKREALLQILIRNARIFIEEHPQSIAGLVLIQDYLRESADPAVAHEALLLIESPAADCALYEQLRRLIPPPETGP